MSKVIVPLAREEREALVNLALAEFRSATDQARYIIRRELERIGLLSPKSVNIEAETGEEAEKCQNKN